MIKKFFFLLLLVFAQGQVFAQGWKFSVAIEPGLSWAGTNEALESKGSRTSFGGTLLGENYFKERYAFYVGLSLMNMTSKLQNATGDVVKFKAENFELAVNEIAKFRVNYLSIPFGLKFKTPDYGLLSYYFQAGLFTGVRVGGAAYNARDTKYSLSKDYNLITAGTQLGLGCMYATGDNTYLQAGLQFSYSFVDALSSNKLTAHPTSLALRLGFLF